MLIRSVRVKNVLNDHEIFGGASIQFDAPPLSLPVLTTSVLD